MTDILEEYADFLNSIKRESIQPKHPYHIPNDGKFHVINVSGGRTSAYMLKHIIDYNNGLPDNSIAIFCNTGKEFPQTLEFVRDLEYHFNVPIVWLEFEYRDWVPGGSGTDKQKYFYKVVNYDTASREGEPFDQLLEVKKMLPNISMRFCTQELKIIPVRNYLKYERDIGSFWSYLGIRADEPKRISEALWTECRAKYPLADVGITEEDILRYWHKMSFNLQLRPHESNCDICFLKGRKIKEQIIKDHPNVLSWWSNWERKIGATFRNKDSVDSIGISCFCGD